jgi:hypothetical protein
MMYRILGVSLAAVTMALFITQAVVMAAEKTHEGKVVKAADGKLTMTEEGITYPSDIVSLDASHFTIRSHNPGGVVEIAMVAAPDVPLPSAQ